MSKSPLVLLLLAFLSAGVAQAVPNRWTGALNNDWFEDGNWSEGTRPVAGQSVLIDTNSSATYTNVLLTNSTPWLDGFVISNRLMTFSNWTTALQATNVTILKDGILTLPAAFTNGQMSNRVYIVCTNFTLQGGGKILADGKGYGGVAKGGYGPGAGTYSSLYGTYYGSGGGHGGQGGFSTWWNNPGGSTYGVIPAPTQPGSSGGSGYGYVWMRGGDGGGVVQIQAGDTVTVDGMISANGNFGELYEAYGWRMNPGGGAGGSVSIDCRWFGGGTGGLIRADGNPKPGTSLVSIGGGAGGGGRIAVVYTNLVSPVGVRFSTSPGYGVYTNRWDDRSGLMGTLYLSDTNLFSSLLTQFNNVWLYAPGFTNWLIPSLMISNLTIGFVDNFRLTVEGAVDVKSGAVLLGTNALLTCGGDVNLRGGQLGMGREAALACGGNLSLTSSSALFMTGYSNDANQAYGARVAVTGDLTVAASNWIYPSGANALFTMRNLNVATNSGFNADERGFPGVISADGKGLGKGLYQSAAGSGAGHGGRGGNTAAGNTGGSSNDVPGNPLFCGSSGGGAGNSTRGGIGGGVIRIQAAGSIVVNGCLTANGGRGGLYEGYGYHMPSGGGAGGSINLICDSFSGGTGAVVQAMGGPTSLVGLVSYAGAGGGGGRVAIWVGVNPLLRSLYLAGDASKAVESPTNSLFWGTLSVTNGLGYTNGISAPNQPQPGSGVFFTPARVEEGIMVQIM